ncbi:MAG: FAD-binding protein [Clostridia bacterium]|nr:FAD-binding protein [Clostridia bacterium]
MTMRERRFDHLVIGSGAAGLASAARLSRLCAGSVALVTENINAGTSRNAGSDKQTYYKLTLASADPDSVGQMARDLFAGGAVDGDLALCEAALSARGFYYLTELGVPFPETEHGESMGYKTDHDRLKRATSAGPYTSKLMTEALEKAVRAADVTILDGCQCIRLLTADGRLYGALCLNGSEFEILWCRDAVLAVGGEAGMFRDSVYPASQNGGIGMALAAGAAGQNLTEWQFGMASIKPRWNVSGTYMQALPRFYSTDREGGGERDFLREAFADAGAMLTSVFLKGYQWPFDVNKCFGGSSFIDLLVYRETVLRGRRVFLDYTREPTQGPLPFDALSEEAYAYLSGARALVPTPFERLRAMNAPAAAFYAAHGVDLSKEPLEIRCSAQHNNGGLRVDADWQTTVYGLYAVGECCGSHGVTRPGGAALNAGQAGAIRAADAVRRSERADIPAPTQTQIAALRKDAAAYAALCDNARGGRTVAEVFRDAKARMSAVGGMVRNAEAIRQAYTETEKTLRDLSAAVTVPLGQRGDFYRLLDVLQAQRAYLYAMLDYAGHGCGSRGSALRTDPAGRSPVSAAGDVLTEEVFRCCPDGHAHDGEAQETRLTDGGVVCTWRPVRPIPETDYVFENQWRRFREQSADGV